MMVALRSRRVLVLAVGLAAAGVVGLQLTGPPAHPGLPVAGPARAKNIVLQHPIPTPIKSPASITAPAGTSNVVVENPTTGAVESEAAIPASRSATTKMVIENPATGAVESVASLDH